MEISNRELTCPFCNQKFKPAEILFYADPAEASFFSSVDSGSEFQAVDASMRRSSHSGGASAGRGGRRDRSLFGSDDDDKPAEEAKADEEEQDKGFPLGVQVNDYVASEFLKKYGDGESFNFKRTAYFYGIKPENEIGENDTGYGYVISYEGNDKEKKIPGMLRVPSREENAIIPQRVCPRCHCDIPDDYFLTDEKNKHHVALIGCTSAGKTQYIIVALRELMDQFDSFLRLGDVRITECSRWFLDMYLRQYESGQLAATKMKKLFPFMISVNPKNSKETYYIRFEDCAGEYASEGVAQRMYAANLPSLRDAKTLLMMIDCSQFFSNEVHIRESELKCEAPYGQALRPIKDYNLYENKEHCVTVITKCDGIFDSEYYIHGRTNEVVNDGMEMVSTMMNAHRDKVDTGLIDRVENEMINMLMDRGQPNVKREIENDLPGVKVKLLPVSTYCLTTSGGRQKLVYDPKKKAGHFRVIEPLLYLLNQWGIVEGVEKPLPEIPEEEDIGSKKKGFWIFRRR